MTCESPALTVSRGLAPARSRPPKCTRPDHGSSPDTARNSVVLPAPLGPSSATTSPGADVQVDAVQHADLAVAGREAGDVQQRISRRDRH